MRGKGERYLTFIGTLHKCLYQHHSQGSAGLKPGNWKFCVDPPRISSRSIGHHWLPSKVHTDVKLALGGEPGLEPRDSIWNVGIPNKNFTVVPNTCPSSSDLSFFICHCLYDPWFHKHHIQREARSLENVFKFLSVTSSLSRWPDLCRLHVVTLFPNSYTYREQANLPPCPSSPST